MQFAKKTSSGKASVIRLILKLLFGVIIILSIMFFVNSIDFPTPKKDIEKIIPNENFKIVK